VLDNWGLEITGTGASVPDGGGAWAVPFLGGLSLLLFARQSTQLGAMTQAAARLVNRQC
jgi:hypothetical protein